MISSDSYAVYKRAAFVKNQAEIDMRFSVREVPVLSGGAMFQVWNGLQGMPAGGLQYWIDDAQAIARRLEAVWIEGEKPKT